MNNKYERLPRNYTILADEYEYTMANGYLVNGKKDTSDDIVDFISEQNGHNLGPHFRSSIAPFLDSMSKTPEQNMTTGYNALDYAFSPTDMERCNENELKLEKAIMDQMVVIG